MTGHVISPEFNAGESTDAAALIGTAAPAIKSMAEPIYEELGLVRIQRWQGRAQRGRTWARHRSRWQSELGYAQARCFSLRASKLEHWENIYGTLGARPSSWLGQQG